MKKVLSRAGQSTMEYVIVLTAIVAAILFAASQFIKPGVNRVFNGVGIKLNASGNFFSSKVGGVMQGVPDTTAPSTTTPSTTTPSTTTPSTTSPGAL